MPGLAVDSIHTYYEDSHVLHGVSIEVAPGEAVALLGRNGAGKTTVIRSIVGFTPPRAGRVIWEDAAIERWPPYRIARRGIALVPQGRRIFAPLTVRENLMLGAAPAAGRSSASSTCSRACASARRSRAARCRVASSRCSPSAGAPDQWPPAPAGRAVEGLAPSSCGRSGASCGAEGSGLSILIVEQNYHLALAIADRVYVMSKGQIVYEAIPPDSRRMRTPRRYLGVA
jgi:branched-chain amino acid transport system ATP-binding protein